MDVQQPQPSPFELNDNDNDVVIHSEEDKVAEEVPEEEKKEEPPLSVHDQMEARKKEWVAKYKRKLDLNDVLEIRNP